MKKNCTDESLSPKELELAEQAGLRELQRLHDEPDAAVADAYGWPAGLDEQEVVRRLLGVNRIRNLN